jgi:hypothetical protein
MEDIFAFVVLWGQIWAYLGLAIKVLYVIVSPLSHFPHFLVLTPITSLHLVYLSPSFLLVKIRKPAFKDVLITPLCKVSMLSNFDYKCFQRNKGPFWCQIKH